jgi:hypothetical protein
MVKNLRESLRVVRLGVHGRHRAKNLLRAGVTSVRAQDRKPHAATKFELWSYVSRVRQRPAKLLRRWHNRPLPLYLTAPCGLRARLVRCFDGSGQQCHHRCGHAAARCRGKGGTSPRVCMCEVWEALCFLRHSTDVYNAVVYRVVGTVHTCFSELSGMMMVGAGNVPVYLLVACLLRGPRALAKSKSSSELLLFLRALLDIQLQPRLPPANNDLVHNTPT